jgi:hypothetical protein
LASVKLNADWYCERRNAIVMRTALTGVAKLTNMDKQYAAHTLTVFDGGTAVERLIFDGKYTQDGTEVIYAGGAYDHIGGLSDFLPQGIVPPHEEHYGGGALPTAFYLSTGVEDVTLNAATVHFGQFGAAV